jgi:molecular chaperone GrpE
MTEQEREEDMSEDKKKETTEREENAEEEDAEEEDAIPPSDDDEVENTEEQDVEPDAAEDGDDEVALLKAEVGDLKDKLLRAMAETENVRRRSERTREDTAKYAISSFAREMLGVADNLKRAMDSVDSAVREAGGALDNFMVGVEMTEREMLGAFKKAGITPIEALDKPFDHNLHEAMFEVEDPEKPAATVIQEVQAGYMLKERLLRPAKVGVSKGGPKGVTSKEETEEASPENETTDTAATAYEKRQAEAGSKLDQEL